MPHPPTPATARPDLDSPESAVALVTTWPVDAPAGQRAVAEAVAAGGADPGTWPQGLASFTVFADSTGATVLAYTQWTSERALAEARGGDGPDATWPPGLAALPGAGTPASTPFHHYRAVLGTAPADPTALPASFPVAFFDTADRAAAEEWLDGLLASEERTEGSGRAYPGALAAHLHISVDGRKVLSFSEWLAEEQAVAHIEAVWEPVLKEFGGTGTLYRHVGTYLRP
ncbi:hypothetical protein ACFVU3_21015 [Streptomyces sp. NPDC058052]|uniref:hypothetical protein n=1 Tax=Streptomyces sp. NPDC058052 TaxID=3346316 RepID=UPI0036E1C32E